MYNRELARHLAARGHHVHVLCLSENREAYASELRDLGLSADSLYMNRYSISLMSDLKVALAIRRYIRNNATSVVVAHGAKAGFLTRLAGFITGTPVIYALHSMPFLRRVQGRKAIFYRYIEKLGTRMGGRLVALTESMKANLVQNKIAPESDITVIYTGIDPNGPGPRRGQRESSKALGFDPERPLIVWAGRSNRQKAPEIFLESAALIRRSQPHAQFILAGEGPMMPALMRLSDSLDLGDSVRMLPWQEDVAGMLSAATVYVMTSRWEGLPLSLLEAMALECAVVATSVDGVAEAIRHEKDGLLCIPDDANSISAQVLRLLQNDNERQRLAEEARARVVHDFSVNKMIGEWEELLRTQTGG